MIGHPLLQSHWLRLKRFTATLGDRYFCPCCGGSFHTFWPSGETADSMRANTLCPTCSSLERHRLLWLYLDAHPDLVAGSVRLLHVAPELIVQRFLTQQERIDYVSIDLDSPLAAHRMDVTRLAFPDCSFDAIICYHVLEHIPDDGSAMAELRRVLKPEGWAILQSPILWSRDRTYEDVSIVAPAERERHFGQHDHVRLYGNDYVDRLTDAGFHVTVDDFAARLPRSTAHRVRIDPEERIVICRRELAGSTPRGGTSQQGSAVPSAETPKGAL